MARKVLWGALLVTLIFGETKMRLPITHSKNSEGQILRFTPKTGQTGGALLHSLAIFQGRPVSLPIPQKPAAPAGPVRTVSSTAYCDSGTMANGNQTHPGAAAMNGIRFGTKFRDVHTGEVFTVEDRIGHGSQFDIWMSSCAAAIRHGRRTRTLEQLTR